MNIRFRNILVPVDFSINTVVAVDKALDLCEGTGSLIHLLHVASPAAVTVAGFHQYFAPYILDPGQVAADVKQQMQRWQEYIESKKQGVNCICSIAADDTIQNLITDRAKAINADLVVIAKRSNHWLLPFLNTVVPTKISEKTGIPVLTVKPGAYAHALKKVVIPVDERFPEEKIAATEALSRKFSLQVTLLSFSGCKTVPRFPPPALVNSYIRLKQALLQNVSYEVIHGLHKAKSILRYCKKHNTDLLIIYPEKETRLGWFNKRISDQLPAASPTQVLAVMPA